jgi:hypothetical protein
MGFEPTTHCWASDFESDRWPVRLSSGSLSIYPVIDTRASRLVRSELAFSDQNSKFSGELNRLSTVLNTSFGHNIWHDATAIATAARTGTQHSVGEGKSYNRTRISTNFNLSFFVVYRYSFDELAV